VIPITQHRKNILFTKRDVIPTVPSSKNYEGGFATELMLKDLTIATQTAKKANASIPLGDHTFSLY
jgi:3-hydroxyisobutyrate dehydrogenase